MPLLSHTPADVNIKPRNRQFELLEELKLDWNGGDAFITAYYNAMSITFPIGEKMFIDSVREFKDKITDPKLKQEMSGFFGQEGFHSREHQRFNEALCELRGYDLNYLEKPLRKGKAYADNKLSAMQRLASTVAAEHLTAIMADMSLREEHWFGHATPKMQHLWMWHAAEELEHKSVAFDVYQAMGGTTKMRNTALRQVSVLITRDVLRGAIHMLRKDKQLWKWSTFKSAAKFLFGKDGLIPTLKPAYKSFFSADFHPWQHDNRELLRQWQQQDPVAA